MKLTRDQYLENRPDDDFCKKCSGVIWYPHTLVVNKNDSLIYINGTFKTTKNVGDSVYELSICYDCLSKEFPEIISKNSSKLFNTCNKYVKSAFLVTDLDFDKQRKKHGITLEKMIFLHGKERGEQAWHNYCEKQKKTNYFEYKNEKFGWDLNHFNQFNKSRAVTKENLISKYGEELGIEKWNAYVDKQKYTKSLQYLIDKFGKNKGTSKYLEINKSKALTLENYTLKYGSEIGLEKFKQMVLKKDTHFSKVSQSFFSELDANIAHLSLTTYYHTKNKEFGKLLTSINKYCKLDFYIKEINLTIEYNGDYWHANPKFYKSSDILYNNQTASDIWKVDAARQTAFLYDIGFPIEEWVVNYIQHITSKSDRYISMLQLLTTLRSFGEEDSQDTIF